MEDTGQGMPKEIQDKLFTPLFTTKAKGHGFRLTVAKRFVEALGGKIKVQSEEGKGTKFVAEIPFDTKR